MNSCPDLVAVRPFCVGLTGGMGSGKSTVAQAFVQHGAGLVDTDQLARELTAPGGAALAPLATAFGAALLGADGSLDRAAMRARVFADPVARTRLEAILHPLIRDLARQRMAALASRVPYVLVDIPLLVEADCRASYPLDRVLVVDCPRPLQVERVMARSGLAAAQVEAVLAAQADRATRLAAADDVIDNSGTVAALAAQIECLHARYLCLAQSHS